MSLDPSDIKSTYPLPVYNYKVEIDGETIGFSEVSGISLGFDTTTYKESPTGGGPGPRIMRMPAQIQDVTITLKKGVVTGASIVVLYEWINATKTNVTTKKDIMVTLCDEAGDPLVSWRVLNAFPTKLDAPSFDASSNDVAVESMELMADRVTMA